MSLKSLKNAQDILNGFNFERNKAEGFANDVKHQNIQLGKEFIALLKRDDNIYQDVNLVSVLTMPFSVHYRNRIQSFLFLVLSYSYYYHYLLQHDDYL